MRACLKSRKRKKHIARRTKILLKNEAVSMLRNIVQRSRKERLLSIRKIGKPIGKNAESIIKIMLSVTAKE